MSFSANQTRLEMKIARSRVVLGALAVLIVGVGCSSSKPNAGAGAATSAPPTPVSSDPAPYAKPGSYAVGYTTLHLAAGRRVVVWYPADPAQTRGHKQETVDLTELLSPALQARVPSNMRPVYKVAAYENAPSASRAAKSPLVVFSHGFAGYPEQSVSLTTHLASWGFVVAAPDHVERSLDGLLGTSATGVPKSTDLAVVQATLALVVRASDGSGILHGMVDPDRVVAAGHSAGASTAYQFASADPRVKAWISYAVGFVGQGAAAQAAPKKPGMVMLGTTDAILPKAASEKVYAGMHAPKFLVEVPRAGHLVFSDLCLIGRNDGGVIGIVKRIHLPIPSELLKFGTDGCTPDHPLVETAFPAIDQLSVAFFRWALHIDKRPVGLTTQAVADLGGNVTVARRLNG
jgi:predicted dienelactone hydrolase